MRTLISALIPAAKPAVIASLQDVNDFSFAQLQLVVVLFTIIVENATSIETMKETPVND